MSNSDGKAHRNVEDCGSFIESYKQELNLNKSLAKSESNCSYTEPEKGVFKGSTIGVDLAGAEIQEEDLYRVCQESSLQNLDLKFYTTIPFSKKCVVCSQVVKMHDDPLSFRHAPDTTLIRALKDLSTGIIDSLVTCANTGSLVMAASIYLKRFVKHPALVATIPSKKVPVLVLDVGAFVTAKAFDLVSYAFLGAALSINQFNTVQPKVGLLNIGKESKKGTTDLKKADALLRSAFTQEKHFSYVGYVEPFDVFSGEVDVLITSGFVGNIFLKTTEGLSDIANYELFSHSIKRGGALLAGVKRALIKCHGKTSETSFAQALFQAFDYASSRLVSRLEETFLNIEKDFIQKYGRNSS